MSAFQICLIIHPNPFSRSQKQGFLPFNISIVTLWIAYWLFLLTTQTWTLNPIGNNYLSRGKKKKRFVYLVFIIEVLVVEKICTCQVFNISLGMQCCCDFRTWLTNSRFSSKDKSRGFFLPPHPFFNSFFFLTALTVIHNNLRPKCHFDALFHY